MIRVKQHVAAFCSGIEPVQTDIERAEDLLGLEFVKRWDDELLEAFCRADRGYPLQDIGFLMALMKDRTFWVLALVQPMSALDHLPVLNLSTRKLEEPRPVGAPK